MSFSMTEGERILLEIDFQHVKFEFPQALERITSPHFSDTESKHKLGSAFFGNKKIIYANRHNIEDGVVLFANEAFPEAAVNDPLGDLRIWNLWQTGIRAFPYPGQYLPLEIFSQGTKVKSTSSMGVLGECLCGIYATSGIGPWPVVRVINRWPDFIFFDRNSNRFALLESKAFANIDGPVSKFEDRFDRNIIQEFLLDALRHLVSDRGVSVWGCFTSVKSIEPFKAQLTMVETTLAVNPFSNSNSTVVDMLADLVLQVALNKFLPELVNAGTKKARGMLLARDDSTETAALKSVQAAIAQLPLSAVGALSAEDKNRLANEAILGLQKNQKKIISLLSEADTLTSNRRGFSTSDYETIREIGDIRLEARRLNHDEAIEIDKNWLQNWDAVGQPVGFDETEIFRCGGLLIKKKYI
jgi:hypothetical protein